MGHPSYCRRLYIHTYIRAHTEDTGSLYIDRPYKNKSLAALNLEPLFANLKAKIYDLDCLMRLEITEQKSAERCNHHPV